MHNSAIRMPDELRDKGALDFRTNVERRLWLKSKAVRQHIAPFQGDVCDGSDSQGIPPLGIQVVDTIVRVEPIDGLLSGR